MASPTLTQIAALTNRVRDLEAQIARVNELADKIEATGSLGSPLLSSAIAQEIRGALHGE